MPFDGDPLGFYGKRLLEEYHSTLLKQLPSLKLSPSDPNPFDISDDVLRFLPQLKVGIIGAGAAGLYTALILDSLGIEYEIIEATGRTGGRISTYKFPNGDKYDYYEQGAMRFPLPKKDDHGQYKDGTMKRVAELTEYGPLNEGTDRLKDKLIPYYYSTREGSTPGVYYFNSIHESVSAGGPHGDFDARGMKVEDDYIQKGYSGKISDDVVNPFIRMLIKDMEYNQTKGWDVMKANDSYSVRSYMASKYLPSDSLQLPPQHLPKNVISWCQLLGGFAGGYDRALTEAVLDSLAFAQVGDKDYGDVDWKCFEGGTETLPKAMEAYIKKTGVEIQFNKRATTISQSEMVVSLPRHKFPKHTLPSGVEETRSEHPDHVIGGNHDATDPLSSIHVKLPSVNVTINGTESKNYAHVISTLPLTMLRTINMNNAGLNVMQKNALRALDYGPAVKIAILFKSDWWTTELGIVGGQTFTDLPIRTVVYPSYGVDSNTPPKVIIASYTWTSDAFRLSALSDLKEREVLKDLVLRNLAEVHGQIKSEITYDYLKSQFVDMDVKDWNHDPNTMGAFAFFSPGEFEDLYTSLNVPAANNRLHFAGEALSTRHAWVVGALDSAWKAVYQYLKVTGQDDKITEFKKIWGENVEWTSDATLVDPARFEGAVPDMLDQHLGLVNKAVLGGVISPRSQAP